MVLLCTGWEKGENDVWYPFADLLPDLYFSDADFNHNLCAQKQIQISILDEPYMGYIGSMAVGVILETLHLIRWEHAAPFSFYGHPAFIYTAWLLFTMLYLHFLPDQKDWYYRASYVLGFATASAMMDKVFNQIGLLRYIHWNPFYRFFLAAVWFYCIAKHYRYLEEKGKRLKCRLKLKGSFSKEAPLFR